jgi:hexosaminidase
MAGIKVAKSIYDPVVEFKKIKGELWVELGSEVPGTEIYYTLDESMPDQKSSKYSTAFFIPLEGTPNLRIRAFRNQKPIGNLLTYNVELLKSKMK